MTMETSEHVSMITCPRWLLGLLVFLLGLLWTSPQRTGLVYGSATSNRSNGNDGMLRSLKAEEEVSHQEELSSEKRLVQQLLRKYAKVGISGRPVRNTSTPITVSFGLGLIKMDVQERDNILSLSAWTRYSWRDEYLTWNPGDYGNISTVKLSQTKIWIPDIMLYNTGSTESFERDVLVVVESDGMINWYPQRIYQSSCSIDVKMFPFDNQTCHLWFGSWTHPVNEVDLQLAFSQGIDLSTFTSDFKESSKWHIDKVLARRITSGPGGSQFAILIFELCLRRRLIFSSYILTFPVVFLSFLTLLVFWLPSDSVDKCGIGFTIFSSLLLLLLILVEAAPPTASGVPILGVYYCFNIVIVIMSIFLSSVVTKVGKSSKTGVQKPVPAWAKMIFFHGFARVLCIKHHTMQHGESKQHGSIADKACHPELLASSSSVTDTDRAIQKLRCPSTCHSEPELCEEINNHLSELLVLLQRYIRGKQKLDEEVKRRNTLDEEWAILAEVLDKLFLVIYITAIIVSLVLFFPR